jgi:hypothetical protein
MADRIILNTARGSARGDSQNNQAAVFGAWVRSYEGAIAKFNANRIPNKNKFNPNSNRDPSNPNNQYPNTTNSGNPCTASKNQTSPQV